MRVYFVRLTLSIIALVVYFQLSAQNIDSSWVRDNVEKIERMVPMRDGAKLFTTIYKPKFSNNKQPILLTRTPYSCSPYGEAKYNARLYSSYHLEYLKKGYIIVTQDVRGRWMSEGEFVDVRPFNPNKKGTEVDEASDTYDAIEWMIENITNNNGKVGVFGISYPGFYSTMAALSRHPALKAVSPQAPVTDWFMGDDFHHNGAFMLMDGFSFYNSFGKPRPAPTTVGPTGLRFDSQDNYDYYLKMGAIPNFTKLMGDSIKFWKDLMSHPNYDEFWKARNVRNFVDDVQPAILTVGGLFDAEDCFGAWAIYKAVEEKNPKAYNKIVMGPWFHGGWGGRSDGSFMGNVRFGSKTAEYYQKNIEIPFFNYHLLGEGDAMSFPEAQVFFTGENEWRAYDEWPIKSAKYKELVINKAGKLEVKETVAKAKKVGKATTPKFSKYVSDPNKPVPYTEDVHFRRTREYMTDDQRFASRRPDVLTFETEILTEDMTLGGPFIADLKVSLSTTDADFIVKLIDVFPDTFTYKLETYGVGNGENYPMGGYQMLVRGETMRGKYRESFEKPIPFTPNKITTVKYTLPDVAHTFKKGHKLMIQVQSTWFPLTDRNPQKFVDIYNAKDSDFQKATIKLYHDEVNQTKFILPVIEK